MSCQSSLHLDSCNCRLRPPLTFAGCVKDSLEASRSYIEAVEVEISLRWTGRPSAEEGELTCGPLMERPSGPSREPFR